MRNQPWFLNQVANSKLFSFRSSFCIASAKSKKLWTRPNLPNGPRTIDIDILLYGNFWFKRKNSKSPTRVIASADSYSRRWPS